MNTGITIFGATFAKHVARFARLVAMSIGVLAIASCGGGRSEGGAPSAGSIGTTTIQSPPISGKVIDGYIRGATVFWDCVNSWRVEDAQVSVKSGIGGAYIIPSAPSPDCVLRAHAGIDAIDEDTNLAFVRAVVFSAMDGKPILISPLTTLVAMGAGTEAEVALSLGIPSDLTKDFLSESSKDLGSHRAASVTTLQLQSLNPGVVANSTSATQAAKAILTNTQTLLTTVPSIYSRPNSETLSWLSANVQPFDSFILPSVTIASETAVNGKMGFSEGQTELLRETLRLAIKKNALHDNLIFFNRIDDSDLVGLNARLMVAFGDNDAVVTLMQSRAADIESLNAEFEAAIKGSNKFLDASTVITLLTNQTRILYGSSQVIAGFTPVAYAKGWVKSVGFGLTATGKLRSAKTAANQLRRFASRAPACLDSINSAALFIDAVVGGRELKDDDMAEAANIFLGAAACIATFSRSEAGLIKALTGVATEAKVAFFYDLIAGLEAAKVVVDTVTSFPVLAQVGMVLNGSFDVGIGLLASWKAIEEFNEAASKGIALKDEQVTLLHKPILERILRDYKARILEARVNPNLSPRDSACHIGATVVDLICISSNQRPVVAFETLATPVSINSPIVGSIRVTDPGDQITNLRVHVGRAFNGSDCQIDIGDYNSLQEPGVKAFTGCASMTATAGELFLKLEARDSKGLQAEVVRTVISVSAAPTTTPGVIVGSPFVGPIVIPATAFLRGTNVALSTNGYGTDTLMNSPPYGEAANAAEWDFNVPVAGTYELLAEYAAAASRPVTIAFNGTLKFNNALAAITGGWLSANRQTHSQGIVALPAGATTMRVSRSSVFPHIRGFKLMPITTQTPLSGIFSVAANSPSGSLFTAPAGASSCAFTATGSWSYGTGSFTSADGRQGFASAAYPALLPSTPYFSLIANTAGGYRAIGSSRTLSISGGQSMYFQINEGIGIGDSYADNSGGLSVSYQCQ